MLGDSEIYSQVVRRAAHILGGAEALASYLDAPLVRVEFWLEGTLRPPPDVFLRLVDVVMLEQAANRAAAPATPPASAGG